MKLKNLGSHLFLVPVRLLLAAALFAFAASAHAAEPKFVEGQIIVKPKAGGLAKLNASHKQFGGAAVETFSRFGDLQLVRLPKGKGVAEAVAFYKKLPHVEYAEPDYIVSIIATPNDPQFTNGTLWGLHNTGQNGGVADADIDAPEAWDVRTDASSIIVAVIDTGVRYTHEDLAANMWKNPGETGLDAQGRDKATNGIDDDGNGLIDDVYGAKYVGTQINGDPNDDNGHGTHCAGTIGGVGNNGKGVTGVCWKVRIMALKFLNSSGSGSTSDAIKCINYAIAKGAHVLSNSWGGGGYSTALYNAINSARSAGIIFVAAAGNNGTNNDSSPFYPASYNLDNIIAVAATDRSDALAAFSNYGAASVHIGAPGVSINSTYRTSDSSYATLNGTSMACPHVSGAVALVKAQFPSLTYSQLRSRILTNVDVIPSLTGKCTSNGRLNLYKALTEGATPPPPAPAQIAVSPASRNFGNVQVGNFSDLTFTVSNTGSETLSGSASVGAPFSIVGGSPYNISGGGNAIVTVRFTPTSASVFNQTVTFTGGGGTTTSVTGTGTTPPAPAQIAVSPASRNFGDVEIGSSSDQTFTVSNTGSETLSGSASVGAPFSIVGGSPYNISGGGNAVVTVRFTPTSAGVANQTVTFTGGGGTTASVTGNGTQPPPPPPVDNPPTVTIASPANGASFSTSDVITFTGSAGDGEDGDLTASIVWTSNLDGVIGNGGSFTDILTAGTHIITASVTDSASQTTTATVTITVAAPPPPPQPPAAPSNLTAKVTGKSIGLSWNDNSDNETGFAIERKTGSGAFTQIATVGANVKTYTDSGLARNTYTYRVRAFNNAGNSAYSNEASGTSK
jgi:subtilisin family serine protease